MVTIREVTRSAIKLDDAKLPDFKISGLSSRSFYNEDGIFIIQIWFWLDPYGRTLKSALKNYCRKDIKGFDKDIGEVEEMCNTMFDCRNGGYIYQIRVMQ